MARRNPSYAEIEASFLHPFSYPPLRRRGTHGELFGQHGSKCGDFQWSPFCRKQQLEGTNPKVCAPQKNFLKQGIWSSRFLRDVSQVVRHTPRDTSIPFYTRTSPWPKKNSREKFGGNSDQRFGAKFGRKFEHSGTFVLQLL